MNQNNEYIEISIVDILKKLWINKIFLIVIFFICLVFSGLFYSHKNFNNYCLTAQISNPINSNNEKYYFNINELKNLINMNSKNIHFENSKNIGVFNLIINSNKAMDQLLVKKNIHLLINKINKVIVSSISYKSIMNNIELYTHLIGYNDNAIKNLEKDLKNSKNSVVNTIIKTKLISLKEKQITFSLKLKNAVEKAKASKLKLQSVNYKYIVKSGNKILILLIFLSIAFSAFLTLLIDFLKNYLVSRNKNN